MFGSNKISSPYLFVLSVLLLTSLGAAAFNVTFYYGQGCPHCVRTAATLGRLMPLYNLSIEAKEIYFNPQNNIEMLNLYQEFGVETEAGGIPSTLIKGEVLVIGELSEQQWSNMFANCSGRQGCTPGVYTALTYQPVQKKGSDNTLTLTVLIGAAIVDSINPCTIAVLVMLLGVILTSSGRQKALIAGILFSATVFLMYFLMGLGIFQAITNSSLQVLFFLAVTAGAGLLAFLELRAFFYYQPGMLSVEMPLFLRQYAKAVTNEATTYPAVVFAAVLCSLFLLPCSSGPYLMVLGMLAKSVSLQTFSYLLLYNFVFVLPMVLITIAIYLGKTTAEEMEDLKETYIRELHLISGIILVVLFLLMLRELLAIINII